MPTILYYIIVYNHFIPYKHGSNNCYDAHYEKHFFIAFPDLWTNTILQLTKTKQVFFLDERKYVVVCSRYPECLTYFTIVHDMRSLMGHLEMVVLQMMLYIC